MILSIDIYLKTTLLSLPSVRHSVIYQAVCLALCSVVVYKAEQSGVGRRAGRADCRRQHRSHLSGYWDACQSKQSALPSTTQLCKQQLITQPSRQEVPFAVSSAIVYIAESLPRDFYRNNVQDIGDPKMTNSFRTQIFANVLCKTLVIQKRPLDSAGAFPANL